MMQPSNKNFGRSRRRKVQRVDFSSLPWQSSKSEAERKSLVEKEKSLKARLDKIKKQRELARNQERVYRAHTATADSETKGVPMNVGKWQHYSRSNRRNYYQIVFYLILCAILLGFILRVYYLTI